MDRGNHNRLTPVVLLALLALLLFQGYAYYSNNGLELSLGPRVVLQPWLMQKGYLLYEHIADEHSPLMYYLLAVLVPVFPDGLMLAKIVLIALLSFSALLTFWIGQRTSGLLGGLGAAFFFVIWSPVFGFGKLWHETLLAPIYILLILLYRPTRLSIKSLFTTGFLVGLGVLIKQYAIVIAAAFIIWNAWMRRRASRSYSSILLETGLLCFAIALPILAFGLFYYLQVGTLDNLLFWTVRFNFVNGYSTLAALLPDGADLGLLLPAYLLVPSAIFYAIDLKRKSDETWQRLGWGLVLLVTSSLTIFPRFGFFHLQPSLPILAWLSSTTLVHALRPKEPNTTSELRRSLFAVGIAVALTILWLGTTVPQYQSAFESNQPRKIWEYTDLVPLADEIRQQIGQTDCFYIFPDDEATANLYYLTRCLPPRYWVLDYPWFMLEPVKNRILATLQNHPPEWIIYFPGRWDIEHRAVEVTDYIQKNYQSETKLHWAQGDVWLLKRQP